MYAKHSYFLWIFNPIYLSVLRGATLLSTTRKLTMYADIKLMNQIFAAEIDTSAKLILFAIIYHANKETYEAFPSWNTLMRETHLSRSSVSRAINELVKAGFITKHRRANGMLIYKLETSPPVDKWCLRDTGGVTETPGSVCETPGECQRDTGEVSVRHPNKSNNKRTITKTTTSSIKEDGKEIKLGMFEEFWASYPSNCPQKMDKAACRKKYLELLSEINHPEEFHAKLLKSLCTWKDSELWQKEGGRFIRSPLSWLERSSWEDNPAPSKVAKAKLDEIKANELMQPFFSQDWELCLERCANCTKSGCTKGVKVPPEFQQRPHPPEECHHFLNLVA